MSVITRSEVYESASSDGYQPAGDGVFFLNQSHAEGYAFNKHGGYRTIIKHHALLVQEESSGTYEQFYLLKDERIRSLYNTDKYKEELKANALKKLSTAEREVLGL